MSQQANTPQDTFMIVKMDITEFCNLDGMPEVARVFNAYCSPANEVTHICSPQRMIFAEDLGVQLDLKGDPSEDRIEAIEELFMGGEENTYYQESTVDSLPRLEWGDIPPEGAIGCVIETEFDDSEDLIDYFRGNGG